MRLNNLFLPVLPLDIARVSGLPAGRIKEIIPEGEGTEAGDENTGLKILIFTCKYIPYIRYS